MNEIEKACKKLNIAKQVIMVLLSKEVELHSKPLSLFYEGAAVHGIELDLLDLTDVEGNGIVAIDQEFVYIDYGDMRYPISELNIDDATTILIEIAS